jgi:hypothetical protein
MVGAASDLESGSWFSRKPGRRGAKTPGFEPINHQKWRCVTIHHSAGLRSAQPDSVRVREVAGGTAVARGVASPNSQTARIGAALPAFADRQLSGSADRKSPAGDRLFKPGCVIPEI